MRPTFFLARKCSLYRCERQAHFTLDDGRVICDFHALAWGSATKKIEKFQEEERKKLPNFAEQIEEDDLPPGDDKDLLHDR